MAREVIIDFNGLKPAEPSTGGSFIRVPPGKYLVEILRVEDRNSNAGTPMFVASIAIADGEFAGKTMRENFVRQVAEGKENFAMARFYAMLIALGLPVQAKKFKLDLDRLSNLRCIVDLYDREMPQQGNYEARTVSAIAGFYPATPAKAAAPKAAPAKTAVAVAEPEPEPETATAEPEEETVDSLDEVGAAADEVEDIFD